jgi:hypothetical protein
MRHEEEEEDKRNMRKWSKGDGYKYLDRRLLAYDTVLSHNNLLLPSSGKKMIATWSSQTL